MDPNFSPAEEAFRAEVRAFIDEHLTPAAARAARANPSVFSEPDSIRAWQRALHERGWVAPGWPVEHGGPDWTPVQRFIFDQECARADTPSLSPLGLRMVGPVIIGFGTPEQKAFYLPRILSGEDIWCQGYSEPGAGSDLASLRTRAVADGDHYVVNGSKIWTTHAHHANRMFALVRTTDGPRKQDGISFILIDMDTPGITVRPIRTMGGDHEVNQVFFDDVRVPVANRVGEEGRGWTYGKYLLQFERGAGLAASRLRRGLERLEDVAEAAAQRGTVATAGIDDPLVAARMAGIENDIDALETMELRIMSALQAGETPGAVSSLLKLRISEIRQALTALAVDLIGVDALVREPRRPLDEITDPAAGLPVDLLPVVPTFFNSHAYTIFGGTSEVQRDIIAKTMLAL